MSASSEVSDSPSGGRYDTPPIRTTFTEAEAIHIRDAMRTAFGLQMFGPYNHTPAEEAEQARLDMFTELAEAMRLFDNVGQSFDVVEVAPENVVTWSHNQ